MTGQRLQFKIGFGLAILLALILLLAGTAIYTVGHFRQVAFDISRRARELPAAATISAVIAEMRMLLSEIKGRRVAEAQVQSRLERQDRQDLLRRFQLFDFSRPYDATSYALVLQKRDDGHRALAEYEKLVRSRPVETPHRVDDTSATEAEIARLRTQLTELDPLLEDIRWPTDEMMIDGIEARLVEIQGMTERLPNELYRELAGFSDAVHLQYRALRLIALAAGVASVVLLAIFLRLLWVWIFRPLRVLLAGSRRVAAGDFEFRIQLHSGDEFDELAHAMNRMTERFEDICDDLDRQVQTRSQEVIRSERLASVGFLAAGVAHEINNPLASIAMCAESLPRRIESLAADTSSSTERRTAREVVEKYIHMIQTEAFRCKTITEKLLDFARTGGGEKSPTDLGELIESMVEMVKTQSRYRRANIEIDIPVPVRARVNPQEIKQVILNLLTNALDSIGPAGLVRVRAKQYAEGTILTVEDDGCGMEPETLSNIFEPFFTKKGPGNGTGLGLAIAHRIVAGYNGRILARSSGLGQGSTFSVELPAG